MEGAMKLILNVFLLMIGITCGNAMAEYGKSNQYQKNDMSFDEKKSQMLERMNATIACINAAQSMEDIKQCRPQKTRK